MLLPRPYQQPPTGRRVNWKHPSAQGLWFLCFGEDGVDLVTGQRMFTPGTSRFDCGIRLANGTNNLSTLWGRTVPQGLSQLVVGHQESSPQGTTGTWSQYAGLSYGTSHEALGGGTWSAAHRRLITRSYVTVVTDATVAVAGDYPGPYKYEALLNAIGGRGVAGDPCYLVANGRTLRVDALLATQSQLGLGYAFEAQSQANGNSFVVHLWAAWNRPMSESEARDLTTAPFGLV